MTEIRNTIRQFILDEFIYDDQGDEILTDDISLLDEGILDSLGILSIIGFLEERFGIQVADPEVIPANLGSVQAMVAYVGRKLERDA